MDLGYGFICGGYGSVSKCGAVDTCVVIWVWIWGMDLSGGVMDLCENGAPLKFA